MRKARLSSALFLTALLAAVAGSAFKPDSFWLAKPFPDWSLDECRRMLRDSPWSRNGSRSLAGAGVSINLHASFHSAEPMLLARATLKQYLPNEFPDRVSWGERILYSGPIDVSRALRYVDKISYPKDRIVVQVIGECGWWSRFDELRAKDLTEWTFLRIETPDRKIELPAESYVRPSQSPIYEALFIFERPEGVRPPGRIEFVTELPMRPHWKKNRRFHLQFKVKFKLEEMIFDDRLVF